MPVTPNNDPQHLGTVAIVATLPSGVYNGSLLFSGPLKGNQILTDVDLTITVPYGEETWKTYVSSGGQIDADDPNLIWLNWADGGGSPSAPSPLAYQPGSDPILLPDDTPITAAQLAAASAALALPIA